MPEQNNAVLPRGVTQEEFDKAVKKFRALLDDNNVLVRPEQLVPYNKIMMPVDNAAHAPSAALTATTVEQIQGILKICNEHKIPIWTISTGRNFGYGSAAPVQRGQVILDLSRQHPIPGARGEELRPGQTRSGAHDQTRGGPEQHPRARPLRHRSGNLAHVLTAYRRSRASIRGSSTSPSTLVHTVIRSRSRAGRLRRLPCCPTET